MQLRWLKVVSEDLKPYFYRKSELSVLKYCALWGCAVVVLLSGRTRVLKDFHEAHARCTKMKSLARCYVWWPSIKLIIILRH